AAGVGAATVPKARVTVRRLGSNGGSRKAGTLRGGADGSAPGEGRQPVTIRVATFNAALFSMAPAVAAVPEAGAEREAARRSGAGTGTGARPRPKGILKAQASLLSRAPSKARVSINLQDNEISLDRSGKLGSPRARKPQSRLQHQVVVGGLDASRRRSVEEVLRETGADIIGLQNVRAEEERGMRPLSELAGALGMRYVFAESWAPEYGNAVLSRWPIKRWKALRVADQSDFRNVLRATIEVPRAGEVNFHCTHLDHLDESWRMKQVDAMLRSVDGPHILAGGLNALDGTDYSADRWADIVKYYEEIGKPTPKVEVMKYLKGKQYVDAKDFAGECEAVVVVAKGQDVQGTCKYGTRVDYILASPSSPYKFVPGSYTVVSSKGTSDHHIVRVDVTIVPDTRDADEQAAGGRKQRVVKMSKKGSRKGIWR
uniref:Endonuclease/exonuclease/phosphatase domain-containing protein n=1 Tax=Aegilops tauschii subsp. strangulata TaxID=200361 RepID=A0A453AWX7_AEGTS